MAIITTTITRTKTFARTTAPVVEQLKENFEEADIVIQSALDRDGKNPLAEEESVKEISKGCR